MIKTQKHSSQAFFLWACLSLLSLKHTHTHKQMSHIYFILASKQASWFYKLYKWNKEFCWNLCRICVIFYFASGNGEVSVANVLCTINIVCTTTIQLITYHACRICRILMLVPFLLPKQPWPVKAWTPLDPWRCAVVSGTKMLEKSCKLWGGASMDRTCLFSTSHRCSFGLRSGEFGGQVNTSNSLLCSSNHSWTFFALWQMRPQPPGNTGCAWSATMLR